MKYWVVGQLDIEAYHPECHGKAMAKKTLMGLRRDDVIIQRREGKITETQMVEKLDEILLDELYND